MLQQLQADVDNLGKTSQQLSGELIGQRSDVEVTSVTGFLVMKVCRQTSQLSVM